MRKWQSLVQSALKLLRQDTITLRVAVFFFLKRSRAYKARATRFCVFFERFRLVGVFNVVCVFTFFFLFRTHVVLFPF